MIEEVQLPAPPHCQLEKVEGGKALGRCPLGPHNQVMARFRLSPSVEDILKVEKGTFFFFSQKGGCSLAGPCHK